MLRQFFSSSKSAAATSMSNNKVLSSKMETSHKSEAKVSGHSKDSDSKMSSDGPSTSKASASSCNDLISLFECPVCFEYVLPPILQCQNGHLVCKSCRTMINTCPTCRVPFGSNNIRNLSLEKLSTTVRFPCKFANHGCQEVLYFKEKSDHEDHKCQFRPYNCPCPGSSCKWAGSMDQVMPHLMLSHKSITTLEGEDIVFLATDINLSGAVDWVMIQSCFNHHFMLVLEKAEKYQHHQQFFAAVVLIGGDKQAENFIYRLELNALKRRLIWEAQPRSINEGVQSAISSSDCLIFDASIANHFSDGGNLGINVTIQPAATAPTAFIGGPISGPPGGLANFTNNTIGGGTVTGGGTSM